MKIKKERFLLLNAWIIQPFSVSCSEDLKGLELIRNWTFELFCFRRGVFFI